MYLLEGQPCGELKLARSVEGGAKALYAIRSAWIDVALHVEDIERIYVDSKIHGFSDRKDFEQRGIRSPVDRTIKEGL